MASKAFDLTLPFPAVRARPILSPMLIDDLLMLAAALVLRCWWYGNPVVQVDEQFYLLVGDRMLHGAVPFVDIWDRKPIGLFLIYAAIRLLGGEGIVQYQLVASVFAAVSALLVVRIARLHAGETAARISGVVALVWMIVFDGAGGQAPVFYTPLVVAAALVTFRAVLDGRTGAALTRSGALAMLLLGVAMQVKYTVISEGVGFGLILSWHGWRSGERLRILLPQMSLWVAIAIAPTAIAWMIYAAEGHGAAFAYANFLSIADRVPGDPLHLAARLAKVALYSAPLLWMAARGLTRPQQGERDKAGRLIACWCVAGLIGFFSIGTFYLHYFLPAVVPLAIAAAACFDRDAAGGTARRIAAGMIGLGLLTALLLSQHRMALRGTGREVDTLASAIHAQPAGCLFVFDGEPILYHLGRRCMVSRYAFPNHLNEHKEAPAIGADPMQEIRHILAARPQLIVSSNRPAKDANRATWALMRQALASDYRAIRAVPIHNRVRILYERRDDAGQQGPAVYASAWSSRS